MTKRHSLILLVVIIALGIGSRLVHTGWILFDKYLGDALYAAMFYQLIGLIAYPSRCQALSEVPGTYWDTLLSEMSPSKLKPAIVTLLLMTGIECFQLTLIPARLYASGNALLKIVAVLLGLQFAWGDLLAYMAGIGVVAAVGRLFADQR